MKPFAKKKTVFTTDMLVSVGFVDVFIPTMNFGGKGLKQEGDIQIVRGTKKEVNQDGG